MRVSNLERAVVVLLLSAKTPEEVDRIYTENISLFMTSSSLSAVLLSTRKRVYHARMMKQVYAIN